MNKFLLLILTIVSLGSMAQDVNVMIKEGQNLERALKEEEALEKYKQVAFVAPGNIMVLAKCSELSAAIGSRQQDKNVKRSFYDSANAYARKALATDSNSAETNYVMSVAASKLAEVETVDRTTVSYIIDAKKYADKALSINPDHAKANYALGKWHFDMVRFPWAKKTAFKTFFGGIPASTIEDAIKYMEKCKALDQYYVRNYLDLAKAYKFDNKPAPAIEVLTRLVRLPTRTADDVNLKSEGKKLLEELQ